VTKPLKIQTVLLLSYERYVVIIEANFVEKGQHILLIQLVVVSTTSTTTATTNLKGRLRRKLVLSTNFVQKRQHVGDDNISTALDSAALPINTI
jgi:hypothetical protein